MSIENNLSKLSLYDAKKYFRRAQNVVFNYTEMESKVREATNNEPWGASSTLMEQISQGTYNYREREEILGMVFRRFTEKTSSEWRQIYKGLQLLEYLIRHGSEKFIDDTRANLSLIKMLESFHYIDSQGRDQGINVRNRAQALVKLLADDSEIRNQRKKARETAKKYKGVAGGAPSSYLPASAINTYAGFGRSGIHGISVSADYDSDEEVETPQAGGFHDNEATDMQEFGAKDDSVPTVHSAGFEGNDDDDDEFADFQSAVPITASTGTSAGPGTSNGTNLLADLYSAGPVVSSAPTTQSSFASGVTPAIQASSQSQADPFSSLFSSAKSQPSSYLSTKTTVTPTSQNKTTQKETVPKHNPESDDGDDDEFGDLAAAPQSNSTSHAQEPDLLSF
ncbi:LAMI_0G09318g1_1 [Lachancea mirantina]|uniref:LAMI_0G09318g1_1 n=1 Tax=Lachancea mirantina TaxID=1230905 RepID=A0A1G4KAC0_9SACH|nr:LAMI_0G09318g1_1 [Lachancea mirantina]